MSAAAQYVAGGVALILLGAIHGAIRRGVDALERTATANEKAAVAATRTREMVEQNVAFVHAPDYPPEP